MQRRKNAFTLIELLVSVAVIGILAGIVVTAINPQETFIAANNAGRDVAVKTIRDAVYQYIIDTEIIPEGLSATSKPICNPYHASPSDCVDLSVLVEENYLTELPVDAAVYNDDQTLSEIIGFDIAIDAQGMVAASAPYYGQTEPGSGAAEDIAMVYWSNGNFGNQGRIQRRRADGTGPIETVYSSLVRAGDLAYDSDNGDLYWTASNSQIRRGNINQSAPSLFITDSDLFTSPQRLALDTATDTIYWTVNLPNMTDPDIRKSSTIAPSEEIAINQNNWFIDNIALDTVNGKIYWSDFWEDIYLKNLNDSGIEELHQNQQGSFAVGFAIDPAHDIRCWSTQYTVPAPVYNEYKIQCSDYAKTAIRDIATGLRMVRDIALDIPGNRVYWVDQILHKIQSAPINGPVNVGIIDIATSADGLSQPWSVLVVRD